MKALRLLVAGFIVSFLVFTDFAQAAVKASYLSAFDGILVADLYTLSGATAQTTGKEVADEIGKRIRQSYYKDGYRVDGYGGEQVTVLEAYKYLSEKKGEFLGLTHLESDVLKAWVEKNQVEYVEAAGVSTNYHGGTGLEDLYIFVPKMPATEVLVIRAFWYAE